jgi:hypothetical protein
MIRSEKGTPEQLIVWILVGVSIVLISIYSHNVEFIANEIGFTAASTVVLIIAVLFLTLMVFWLYGMILELRTKLDQLHDALSVSESITKQIENKNSDQ